METIRHLDVLSDYTRKRLAAKRSFLPTQCYDSLMRERAPASARTSGFVLVGGRSSRMGSDKAFLRTGLRAGDMCLAAHVAAVIASVCDAVSLVGDPGRYGEIGFRVIADDYPGLGPVGAIATALHSSDSKWNVAVACDMPAVSREILERILAAATSPQNDELHAVVPVTPDGRVHPLCAAYSLSALAGLREALERDDRKLTHVLSELRTLYLPCEDTGWARNVNTPEEWASYVDGQEQSAAH
jgi:molybdopterin-guanine dinucleotide biosynthesis protein A